MTNYQEIYQAAAWVADSVLPKIPVHVMARVQKQSQRNGEIVLEVGDSTIYIKPGRPTTTWMGNRPFLAEQIVVTGTGLSKGPFGWNSKSRTFKAKDDGSFNAQSIAKAIEAFIEGAVGAQQRKDARKKELATQENARVVAAGKLRAGGLKFEDWAKVTATMALAPARQELAQITSPAVVRIEPDGLCSLEIKRLSPEQALAILELLR